MDLRLPPSICREIPKNLRYVYKGLQASSYLKGAMHKGFIQVNNYTNPSLIFLCHLWEQACPWDLQTVVSK